MMAATFDERHARLDRAGDCRLKIDDLVLELDLTLADTADVEQIVEEPRHLVNLALEHRVQRFVRGVASCSASQHLGDVANRRQRIAQFVTEHCEKLILAAIGSAQKLLDAYPIRYIACRLGNADHTSLPIEDG